MNSSGLRRDYARRNSSRDRVAESLRVRNADKATKVQQVRISGRIRESARSGSQATQRATIAYLRRGCFTIGTGSMSTERKQSSNGDKKEKKERTQKGKRGKKEEKEEG